MRQVLLLVFLSVKIHALGVSPTYVSLSSEAPIVNFTLSNDREFPITIQIDVVRWQQAHEQDVYTATDELILTPQIFKLAPHGSQLIRVGLEEPAFGQQEKTYRIFAQEVLPEPKEKINGIRMAIRISLPLVIKPTQAIQQKIDWSVFRRGNQLKLVARNKGNNLLFIGQLQAFSTKQQAVTKKQSTFAYILPGSRKTWILDTLNNQMPIKIKALVNNQEVFEDVA